MFSRLLSVYAPIALAASIAFAGSADAQTQPPDAMSSAPAMRSMADIPCERADSALMSSTNQMKSMTPSPGGDLDTDFARMMNLHDTMMMDMAKLEVRCGKKPNVKEDAERFMQNLRRTHRFSGDSG